MNCSKSKIIWFGTYHLIWPHYSLQGYMPDLFGVTLTKYVHSKIREIKFHEICHEICHIICKQTADFMYFFCMIQVGAPKELLQNQEASLLRDIRDAINKRIQNRISTARRFAVSISILFKIHEIKEF